MRRSIILHSITAVVSSSNRYFISDIHGCYLTLKTLLQKIRFNSKDMLYLLGDNIDRGPDSKKVLDWIIKNDNVVSILGNHEKLLLDSLSSFSMFKNWMSNGGDQTLKSFDVHSVKDIPVKYINYLNSMKTHLKIDKDIVAVHGGIDFTKKRPYRSKTGLVWNRDVEAHPNIKQIVGHTPKDLHEIVSSLYTNKIFIDGGCAYGGYLVVYNLDKDEIQYQKCIDIV